MQVSLVRVQANGKTAELKLKRSSTVFGRGDEADVRIPAAGVSRTHCRLSVSDDGAIAVEDMGSSNGTYVNQERVEKAPLASGDLVSFGGFVFVVRVNGDPEEIDAELSYEDGIPEEAEGSPKRAAPAHVTKTAAASEPLMPSGDMDESSVVDFDFDFDEDEDDQPPL